MIMIAFQNTTAVAFMASVVLFFVIVAVPEQQGLWDTTLLQ